MGIGAGGHRGRRRVLGRRVLRPLAARMLGIAAGLPFQPQCAAGIGAALVEADVTGSEALGRSLTVIGRHLARARETPGSSRVSALLEALRGGIPSGPCQGYQRRHDPLTGLANRALFLDNLAAALSGSTGPRGGSVSALSTSTGSSPLTTPSGPPSATGYWSRSRTGSRCWPPGRR